MSRYVAEFRNVEVTDERKVTEQSKSSQEIVNKKGIDTKTVGKYATMATAATLVGSQLYARYQASSNSITGNSVAQRKLDNTMAYINEGVSVFGSIGIGALVGGPAGAVAGVLAVSVRLGMNAYNTGLENRVKQANWQVESIVNGEVQRRLVQNITGGRV
jgi:hypothetical protein